MGCTDRRAFEVVERLVAGLGEPVVTSNRATLWDALGRTGVDASDLPLGRLFHG